VSERRTRLAVLGSPIAHSLSPSIHRAAYGVLGLPWHYEAIEMTGERLPGFVEALDTTWRGLSLTMPLKRDVLPILTTRHAMVDRVGGANTVLLDDSGIHGFNTDVRGVVESFRGAGVESLSTVEVLGAGATAASVMVAVAELGGSQVTVVARTPEKAGELVALGEREGMRVSVRPWTTDHHVEDIPDAVISTVPGGRSDLQFPESVRAGSVLFDVAYDPWPSGLALAWADAGGPVISGIDLLLHQAIGQVRVFVGGDPEVELPEEPGILDAMRAAVA
jgi:shikimate dehydrogenase